MRQNKKTFRVNKDKVESINLDQDISEIASTIRQLRALKDSYAKSEIDKEQFLFLLGEYIMALETDCAYYERKLGWLIEASQI